MRVGLFSKLLVVAILLILLSIVLPVAKVENVDAILASATFLYGIFYGFYYNKNILNESGGFTK